LVAAKGKGREKRNMKIKIYTTGGTIDKVYFDQKSKYEVGEPTIKQILREAQVNFEYECESLFKKDSLDMTDDDRKLLFDKISADGHKYVIVIHGTDTMIETAKKLIGIPNKVIVLTGAIEPARSKISDAPFNIGSAVTAVQVLPPGVYIAFNGRIYHPSKIRKNLEANRFEEI
jgi:L-asparaginase